MFKMKIIAIFLCFVYLTGCAAKLNEPEQGVACTDDGSSADELYKYSSKDGSGDEFYEYSAEYKHMEGYDLLWAVVMCPSTATEEDIEGFTREYVQIKLAENPSMFIAAVSFYDAPIFLKYWDTPVSADVRWSPNGVLMNVEDFAKDDYSNHDVYVMNYNECDAAYALTEDERELYCLMQNLAIELYDKPLKRLLDEKEFRHMTGERDKYDEISEELDVSAQTLIDLRIKVCMWRDWADTSIGLIID